MNYLFRYIQAIRPHEVERLAALQLSRRERETLDLLTSLEAKAEPTRQEAMERLGMSGSMFDKTCSTILRRLLAEKAPQGGTSLLEHLAGEGLFDLLLHELRRQEKEHLKSGDREKLKEFYSELFRILHLRFSSEYPEQLARRIATRYRRLSPSADTYIYTEACMLTMSIWTEASRKTGEKTRSALEGRLRRNDERITPETGPLARYKQLKGWITFYGQLKRDPDSRMKRLQEAAALCERHPGILSAEERVLTLCQIAEDHYFYRTDLHTPLRMYRDIYQRYPQLLEREDYHTFKFTQLCLINGEYDQAERLLLEHFGTRANLEVHGGGRSKTIALLWTKFALLTDRFSEARRHLDDAIILNQKSFYLQFEIECRMLHTALCFLEGDLDIVERRLSTHIKFLRSKGITYTTSRFYPWFFKLVGAFIDERLLGKQLSPKLESKFGEYMEGAAAQYGVLLRKMRWGE